MRLCGGLAAALVALIALAVSYDVVARNLGWGNLPWVLEITEYALPLGTLFAAPWLMYTNQHVRLDLLETALSAPARRRLARWSAAIGLVVSLVFVWHSIAVVVDAYRAKAIVLKTLSFPEWWLFTPLPFAFTLLALECGRRLVARLDGTTK